MNSGTFAYFLLLFLCVLSIIMTIWLIAFGSPAFLITAFMFVVSLNLILKYEEY